MKKFIFSIILLLLDLILIIGGLTLLIVSFFVDDGLGTTFMFIGNYGVGAAIGSLLVFIAIAFFIDAFDL